MNQSISEEFDEKFQEFMLLGQVPSPKGSQRVWSNAYPMRESIKSFLQSKISQAIAEERKELREQEENTRRLLLEVKAHERRYSHIIKRIQGFKEENDNMRKRDTTGMVWYRRACDDILHLLENEPL